MHSSWIKTNAKKLANTCSRLSSNNGEEDVHLCPGSWIKTLPHSWQKGAQKHVAEHIHGWPWFAYVQIWQDKEETLSRRDLVNESLAKPLHFEMFLKGFVLLLLYLTPLLRRKHPLHSYPPSASLCQFSSCSWQRKGASHATASASVWCWAVLRSVCLSKTHMQRMHKSPPWSVLLFQHFNGTLDESLFNPSGSLTQKSIQENSTFLVKMRQNESTRMSCNVLSNDSHEALMKHPGSCASSRQAMQLLLARYLAVSPFNGEICSCSMK